MQASAELQLAARVDGITQEDVRDALWRDRTLVKAWTLRGTLHLHAADELALWLGARPERSPELGEWRDPAGVVHPAVSADEAGELRAAVWEALDGRCLLREELVDEVLRRVKTKHAARLRSGFAFFTGELCQGPPQGNKIRLARPDQWVERWRPLDPDHARREVLRRYLRTYGPARPQDVRGWFGGDVSFAGLDVEEVDVEGHRAYVLAGDATFPMRQLNVRLLPEYDVYVMGFRERDHLVPEAVREQVARHGRGRYEGPAGVRFLVVDGVAAGLWERKKRGKRVEITIRPVQALTPARRRRLDDEIGRVGDFLGLDAVVIE